MDDIVNDIILFFNLIEDFLLCVGTVCFFVIKGVIFYDEF